MMKIKFLRKKKFFSTKTRNFVEKKNFFRKIFYKSKKTLQTWKKLWKINFFEQNHEKVMFSSKFYNFYKLFDKIIEKLKNFLKNEKFFEKVDKSWKKLMKIDLFSMLFGTYEMTCISIVMLDPKNDHFLASRGQKMARNGHFWGTPPRRQKVPGVGGSPWTEKIAKKNTGFLRRGTANGTWRFPVHPAKKGGLEGHFDPWPPILGSKPPIEVKIDLDFETIFSLWKDFFHISDTLWRKMVENRVLWWIFTEIFEKQKNFVKNMKIFWKMKNFSKKLQNFWKT